MRLSALRLHWVKAVYLCLLHPLLDWRPADKRELVGNKAKGLTELWTPAVDAPPQGRRRGHGALHFLIDWSQPCMCLSIPLHIIKKEKI